MDEVFMVVKFKAKKGKESALAEELSALAQATHLEEGCLLYALHRDLNDPSQFVIIERFASKSTLDVHYAFPYFSKHFSVISSLIEKEPEVVHLTPMGSSKKGKLF